ncbi:hypothetical protein [Amycolatopsis sp. NPDC051372]|uniref:hypothetical protein n=1 Tax=Amycolatopsis sp. NPDC051372 TaxID=3155669 RepID=UPI00343DAB35
MTLRHGASASALLLAALAAAGCTTSTDAPSSRPAAASSAESPAADGTNYSSCTDGDCEVAVSGPTDIPLGGQGDVATLSVTEVEPAEPNPSIAYDVIDTDGTIGHGYVISGETYGVIGGLAPTVNLEVLRAVGQSVVLSITMS